MIQGSPHRVKLPGNIYREIDLVLRHKHIAKPDIAFSSTQQYLLERLYQADFQVSTSILKPSFSGSFEVDDAISRS